MQTFWELNKPALMILLKVLSLSFPTRSVSVQAEHALLFFFSTRKFPEGIKVDQSAFPRDLLGDLLFLREATKLMKGTAQLSREISPKHHQTIFKCQFLR